MLKIANHFALHYHAVQQLMSHQVSQTLYMINVKNIYKVEDLPYQFNSSNSSVANWKQEQKMVETPSETGKVYGEKNGSMFHVNDDEGYLSKILTLHLNV